MLGVCILFFRRRAAKHDAAFDFAPRSRSNSRANLRASLANLSAKPDYKDGKGYETDYGQGESDLSSGNSGTLRKMRQYDNVYRTNEPLKGKPEIEFPEKKLDLSEDEIMSSGSNENREYNPNSDNVFTYGEPNQQLGRSRQRLNEDDHKNYDSSPTTPPLPTRNIPESPDSPIYSTAAKSWARDNTIGQYGHNINPAHTPHYSPPYDILTQNVGLPRSSSRSTEV